jgi:ubiquinone/menaquinone biosynthesis C-methylase UbiE
MSEETYALSASAAEAYEHIFVPALFRDWAERLVRFAGIEAGRSVLDVACGTGIVARTAADRLDAVHRVVGLDANPAMLGVARGIRPELEWVEGEAEELPFPDSSFDIVVSQAGLMFFRDRVTALREMARVTRATVAIQVPGRLAKSAGYRALAEVINRHAGPIATELFSAYFAVGEPALLHGLCADAGLVVEAFETWYGATRLDSLETLIEVELLPISDTIGEHARRRIADECRSSLAPFIDDGGAVATPIEVHLLRASATGYR